VAAQYNLLNRGFKNVSQNGSISGFQVAVKSGYYRGVYLPLIEGFDVTVDGETFARDQIRATFGGRSYTLDELETATNGRWPWMEPAILTINKPGGLKPGLHDVEITTKLRISYMPVQPSVFNVRAQLALVA
jgi:uncharacterized protein DUF6379